MPAAPAGPGHPAPCPPPLSRGCACSGADANGLTLCAHCACAHRARTRGPRLCRGQRFLLSQPSAPTAQTPLCPSACPLTDTDTRVACDCGEQSCHERVCRCLNTSGQRHVSLSGAVTVFFSLFSAAFAGHLPVPASIRELGGEVQGGRQQPAPAGPAHLGGGGTCLLCSSSCR